MRRLRVDWTGSYRYFGGVRALARCLAGTAAVLRGAAQEPTADVETVTFSVIPGLTALWAVFMEQTLVEHAAYGIIGDCSGGLHQWALPARFRSQPVLNHAHGHKLDLFLRRVCTAEYVLLNDDDVFWLSPEPLAWALEQFRQNDRVVVVSLRPRPAVSSVMHGKVDFAMGSYCLMVKRSLWLEENLSFEIVHPPPSAGYDWYYDTADFAQMELLRRGYEIPVAPSALQEQFVDFDGLSSWGMRIRRSGGDLRNHLRDITVRHAKAYQTVCAFEGFRQIVKRLSPDGAPWPLFVPDAALAEARASCEEMMDAELATSVEEQVQASLDRITQRVHEAISN